MAGLQSEKNEKKDSSSKDGNTKNNHQECSMGNCTELVCSTSIEEANTLDFCVIKNNAADDEGYVMEDSSNTGSFQ